MNCTFNISNQRRVVGRWGIQCLCIVHGNWIYMMYTPAPSLLIDYKVTNYDFSKICNIL